MMEESRKVYGWLVRDGKAAVGYLSMWADTMGGENYCGNLLRQSSLTLLFRAKFSVAQILIPKCFFGKWYNINNEKDLVESHPAAAGMKGGCKTFDSRKTLLCGQ